MGFMDKIIGTPEARAAHREAREHLDEVSRRDRDRDREESDDFVDANRAVIDAEQGLPRWRRGPS